MLTVVSSVVASYVKHRAERGGTRGVSCFPNEYSKLEVNPTFMLSEWPVGNLQSLDASKVFANLSRFGHSIPA